MSQFSNPAGRAPVAAGAYVRSVIGLVGERDPLEILNELPAWLEARTLPLDDAARRAPSRSSRINHPAIDCGLDIDDDSTRSQSGERSAT